MIRLSTAHARARLSKSVEEEDANAAIELVHFAYFKKVLEHTKKNKRPRPESDSEEDVLGDDAPTKKKRTKKSAPREDGDRDVFDFDSDNEVAHVDEAVQTRQREIAETRASSRQKKAAEPAVQEDIAPTAISEEK